MSKLSFRPSLTLRGRSFNGPRGWAGQPLHPPLTDVPIGFNVETAGSHPAWEPSGQDVLPGEEPARVSGPAAPMRPVRRDEAAGSR